MTNQHVRAATVAAAGEEWNVESLELSTTLRDDEVLVRMEVAGLCHSDEHVRTGSLPAKFPLVGGHEGAGIVVAVGSEVTRVAPGDRVACTFRPICGHCDMCAKGKGNLCVESVALQSDRVYAGFSKDGQPYASTNLIGAFADHVKCPEFSVVPVADDVPAEVAALLGCAVATGIGAVRKAGELQAGERVMVVGVGGVGINAVQGAKLLGASRVAAVDLSETKLSHATTFGATDTFTSVEKAVEAVGKFDLIVLTVGAAPLLQSALDALAPAGRLVIAALGNPETYKLNVPVNALVRQDIAVRGTILGSSHLLTDIDWIVEQYREGKLMLDELVTHRFTLEQIKEGYEALHSAEMIRGVVTYSTPSQ